MATKNLTLSEEEELELLELENANAIALSSKAQDQKVQLKMPTLAEKSVSVISKIPSLPISPAGIDISKPFTSIPNPFETDISKSLKKAGAKVEEASRVPPIVKDIIPSSPEEIAISAGTELGLPLVGAAIGGAVKLVAPMFKVGERAEKIMASALKLLPTEREAITKMAGVTPEKWLLQRQITGAPLEIAKKLGEVWKKSKGMVDNILSKSQSRHNFKQAGQALDELTDVYRGTAGNEEKLSRILELKSKIGEGVLVEGKRGLNLSELNEVKRLVDDADKIFKGSGEVKAGAKAEGLKNIRQNLQEFIEDIANKEKLGNVKALNKETQVAYNTADAIVTKHNRQLGNNIFTLTEKIFLAGGLSAIGVGSQAGIKAGATAGIIPTAFLIGEHIASNPTFKINIAMALQRLAPNELKVLQSGFKSPEAQKIVKNVLGLALRESGVQFGTSKIEQLKSPANIE